MPGKAHVNSNARVGRCLFAGCTGKALYRVRPGSERGYCRDHKHMIGQRSEEADAAFADFIQDPQDTGGLPWVPAVKEE